MFPTARRYEETIQLKWQKVVNYSIGNLQLYTIPIVHAKPNV